MPTSHEHGPIGRTVSILIRAITAAGLAVDAQIHFKLAPAFDAISGGTITQGGLFRVEAVLAVLAAVAVLLSRRTVVLLAVAAVAGGGLVPLLVYRYFNVGAIGPVPNMFEPAWYPDKTNTAIAQVVATLAALLLLLLSRNGRRTPE